MHRDFEDGSNDYTFCLVLVNTAGQSDAWRLIPINETKKFERRMLSKTWNDFDGRELKFLNDQRPSYIFLHFHHFLCDYKAIQERTEGWQKACEKSGTRELLKKLTEVIGDEVEVPEHFADGAMMVFRPFEQESEIMGAKDLTYAFLSFDEFEPFNEEEGDD